MLSMLYTEICLALEYVSLKPVDGLLFYGFSQETAEEMISKGKFDDEEDDVYTFAQVHMEAVLGYNRFGRLWFRLKVSALRN